jgi:hypothetical protein
MQMNGQIDREEEENTGIVHRPGIVQQQPNCVQQTVSQDSVSLSSSASLDVK